MSLTILIVDDSATIRAMIRKTIRMAGLPTDSQLEAANGAEALEVLRTAGADLVLADLHMPVMGGLDLVKAMKADPKLCAIPVVVVSADPNPQSGDLLAAAGAAGFVRKPFTPEAIRQALAGLLEVSHA